MFFRRARPQTTTTQEKLSALPAAGFTVTAQPGGASRVTRDVCAVDLKEVDGTVKVDDRAGILMAGEIGVLVDGGYQKFFRTPSGKKKPALAEELKALHEFEEDLKERLGLTTLYNEALGTTSTLYQYDRVKDRDKGGAKRVWE
jgi:hypothetical protein